MKLTWYMKRTVFITYVKGEVIAKVVVENDGLLKK